MVKIAIAGGSSEVAQEILTALLATNNHDILLLTRKPVSSLPPHPHTIWTRADYTDAAALAGALQGVHTLLSFITVQTDPENQAQRNLIAACVAAGVRRFAPSEWATSNLEGMAMYAGKSVIRAHLAELNRERTVLEYTLFQPGLFTNYLTHPHRSAAHVGTFETQFDFARRRAIIRAGGEADRLTLTTVQDLARVVARAVEYEGAWPVVGGVRGQELTLRELLDVGARVRGAPFAVETVPEADLQSGALQTSWLPVIEHPAISAEAARAMAGPMLAGMTRAIAAGGFVVSAEWNRLLPDLHFVQTEDFLAEAWRGKD